MLILKSRSWFALNTLKIILDMHLNFCYFLSPILAQCIHLNMYVCVCCSQQMLDRVCQFLAPSSPRTTQLQYAYAPLPNSDFICNLSLPDD